MKRVSSVLREPRLLANRKSRIGCDGRRDGIVQVAIDFGRRLERNAWQRQDYHEDRRSQHGSFRTPASFASKLTF